MPNTQIIYYDFPTAPILYEVHNLPTAKEHMLVEPGQLEPDGIHTASIYVQKIFVGKDYEKPIEQRTVRAR